MGSFFIFQANPSATAAPKRSLHVIVFLAFFNLLFLAIALRGWAPAWRLVGGHPMIPIFADMRTVQVAPAAIAHGFNPQVLNPGDPWGRAMNYPMVWISIARAFHFEKEINFRVTVLFFVLGFILSAAQLIRRFPSVWLLLTLISGSAFFAIERGNNDLLVFTLVFLGCVVSSAWIALPILLIAVVLKVYPVFAGLLLLRNRKAFLTFLVLSGGYLISRHTELAIVRQSTPMMSRSYGVPVMASVLTAAAHHPVSATLLSVVLVVIATALFALVRTRSRRSLERNKSLSNRLFLAGAGIYVATFFLISNFDYRIIFLAFCVPFLTRIENTVARRTILLCVLFSANCYVQEFLVRRSHGHWFPLDLLCETIVFLATAVLLAKLLVRSRFWSGENLSVAA